jgi:hypothetical protein
MLLIFLAFLPHQSFRIGKLLEAYPRHISRNARRFLCIVRCYTQVAPNLQLVG